jgi:hypothetical protein
VRNAHSVPIWRCRIGVSRESIRPGKLLPKQPATGNLLTNLEICEKVRLRPRPYLEMIYFPVGAGGGGGGGGGAQQAETPSVAAAKATRVKYLTMFIRRSISIAGVAEQAHLKG